MKKLITELDIIKLHKEGKELLPVGENEILTPLAKDKIKQLGIKLITKEEAEKIESDESGITRIARTNKIAIGSDHTGFKMKNFLTNILINKKIEVIDVGTYDENSCDYPDFAFAVAAKVKDRDVDFGIIIDATGIPSAITANKVKGIRAATCYNEFSARSAREHNNANVLVLGAKAFGEETINSILNVWLSTNFGGGRHQKRLNKITAIENKGTL
jgi:ribose 5-phosphate isomerase B